MHQVSMCLNLLDDERHRLEQLRSGKIKVRRHDDADDIDATVEAMEVCNGTIYRLEELYRVLESQAAKQERLANRLAKFERGVGGFVLAAFLVVSLGVAMLRPWE